MKRVIFILLIFFIFFLSCSSETDEKKEVKNNKSNIAQKENTGITTDYKYEKLDLNKLYSDKDKEVLSKIDFSSVKNLENSLLYSMDKDVYIERSPYEIYGLLEKKAQKRTLEDEILYLRLSLELGYTNKIDKILNNLKNEKLSLSELKKINSLLLRFDLTKKQIEFLDYKINVLLKENDKFNKENETYFLNIISLLEEIKKLNLVDLNTLSYFEKYFKKDLFNVSVNDKYLELLTNEKKYDKAESFIKELLKKTDEENINYDKRKLFASLVKVYKKNNDVDKIKDLYLKNTKLPDNKDLFFDYIRILKDKKLWISELKYFASKYNENKKLQSFYEYYFALEYDGKNNEKILKDYSLYLLKNFNDKAVKDISSLLINTGLYKMAFDLLNVALIEHGKSSCLDDYVINMEKVLERMPYDKKLFQTYYFFSEPEIIGGLLSLFQNQFKDNDFLITFDDLENSNKRVEDISYLYDKYRSKFSKTDKLKEFSNNYFRFLKRYNRKEELKILINNLISVSEDMEFKIFLLKEKVIVTDSLAKKNVINENIFALYLKLLQKYKNNKVKFNKNLNDVLAFLNNFSLTDAIKKAQTLLKLYPQKEKIYETLLDLFENYRAYEKKLYIYDEAVKRFNKKTWADKYARYLIRKKWNGKMLDLNKKLLNLLNKDEYQDYLFGSFPYKSYGKMDSPFNSLYEKIYVDALKKYPFNKKIIDKLLNFYDDFRTSYYYKNSSADYKYAALLYKYIYIFDDYRDKYFKDRIINKNFNHEQIITSLEKKVKKSISELKYLAYITEYRAEYEKSVKYYSILSKYYITDEDIIFKTAKLYKSLASSFYIKDKSLLDKAEVFYKRLTFLHRNKTKYYISLAELYYDLSLPDKAKKNLFRALEYQKGNKDKYIAIANMFYDYYDYDNALKTIYVYRERKKDNLLLAPFAGRLFELKNQYQDALNEYFSDLFNEESDSYNSEKRLIALWNKKDVKDLITLKVEENLDKFTNNELLFNKIRNFLTFASQKELLEKLYTRAYENSDNIRILKTLYEVFKQKDDKRLEGLLKKLEKYEKSDEIYYLIIEYYKNKNNVKEVADYYEKLLLNNDFKNDKYRYISIISEYTDFLIQNKEYQGAINKYRELLSFIKDKDEKIKYELKILDIYKLISENKYTENLLKLNETYPLTDIIAKRIISYYKDSGNLDKGIGFIKNLISLIKKDKKLTYQMKKRKIEYYKNILIEQLILNKNYSTALDWYIELLNREPLNEGLASKVYGFAKLNGLTKKLFDYYEKLSKKSFKNYKYMILNARLNEFKENFDISLSYYQKAYEIEPQDLSIAFNIYENLIKLRKYKSAYDFINDLHTKNKDNFMDKEILKKLLSVSILLNDTDLIEKNADKLTADGGNILFTADILYKYGKTDLAVRYYKFFIDKNFNNLSYITDEVLYRYSKSYLEAGKGLDLLKEVIGLFDKTENMNSYGKTYFKNSLCNIISDYIPEGISYLDKTKIENMTNYLKNLDFKYNKCIAGYFKKLYMPEEYFKRLSSSYLRTTKFNYYKSVLDYDKIIDEGLYKKYDYKGRERYFLNEYKKAFLSYVWKDKERGFAILERNILSCNKNYKNRDAIRVYINYLNKNYPLKYKKLVNNKCIYEDIVAVYLENKEKELALKLIDNQNKDMAWKLKEKLKVYEKLKIYNDKGIKLYNKLLSLNLKIKDELHENNFLLNENDWDIFVEKYSSYLLKANKTDKLQDYINNIIEISPKNIYAYMRVADIYFKNKDYANALKYLNYAYTLKRNNKVRIKLYEVALKLKKYDKTKLLLKEIIASENLNDYYYLYLVLDKYHKINKEFINRYADLVFRNYKDYGFYKLKKYIYQILKYYEAKGFNELLVFIEKFSSSKDELYKFVLNGNKNINDMERLLLMDKLISFYNNGYGDIYPKKTWIRVKTEYLRKIKKTAEAVKFIKGYEGVFKYEDREDYLYTLFKLYYELKNTDKVVEYLNKSKRLDMYAVNKYVSFILKDKNKAFAKKLFSRIWDNLKDDNYLYAGNLIDVAKYFKDFRFKALYVLNNRYLTKGDYDELEIAAESKGDKELIKIILNDKYHKFYRDYPLRKAYSYKDGYGDYIMDLMKLNKKKELYSALKTRPLSVSEIKEIIGKLRKYGSYLNNTILSSEDIQNNDVYYIKAYSSCILKDYQNAEKYLNLINISKDYKYNYLIHRLKTEISMYSNKKTEKKTIMNAIKFNPYSNQLKFMLFKYYKNNNSKERALFVLAEAGLYIYLAFDELMNKDFSEPKIYSGEYEYDYDYYDFYRPENIVKRILDLNKDKKEIYYKVNDFVKNFNKEDKKEILKFLYELYKTHKKYKKFGLSVLYAYSKFDKNYKKEYEELLKTVNR